MLELTLDARLDLAASSARHGAGLFETLRVKDGRVLRLAHHLERLDSGCRFLGLEPPPKTETVQSFLEHAEGFSTLGSGVLRLWAVDRALIAGFGPWEPVLPDSIQIGLSKGTTRLSSNPCNRYKTLSYLENLLMIREAQARGLFEVLALNESGALTDGGRTNVFLALGGDVFTPQVQDGALPGVARRQLLEAGLAKERRLLAGDLDQAEAVFLTNSLQGLLCVERADWGRSWNPRHPWRGQAELVLAS